MDAYDAYLADQAALHDRDREIRLGVLEAYAHVEAELIGVGVFYLGGASMARQEAVERCIDRWGGIDVTLDLVRRALPLHGVDDGIDRHLQSIKELRELRNLIAHSRVETFQANDPTVEDGREGREVLKRSRSGQISWQRIDFDEAERRIAAARLASESLSRLLADVTRGLVGTHNITYGPEGACPAP